MKIGLLPLLLLLLLSLGYQFNADGVNLKTAVNLWTGTTEERAEALSTYRDINTWDTSLVDDMSELFKDKTTFNDDIGNWDVSAVTTMEGMFRSATIFDQDISNWKTGNVLNMKNMFRAATTFDKNINTNGAEWDVSAVTTMREMFRSATIFDQDISEWNTSEVTNMRDMFRDTDEFNQNIGGWDVSKVTVMHNMFENAKKFNNGGSDSIKDWTTWEVTTMASMFNGALVFNQSLENWNIKAIAGTLGMDDMFDGTFALTADNIGLTLIGWADSVVESPVGPYDITIRYEGQIITDSAQRTAFLTLATPAAAGWTFEDLTAPTP